MATRPYVIRSLNGIFNLLSPVAQAALGGDYKAYQSAVEKLTPDQFLKVIRSEIQAYQQVNPGMVPSAWLTQNVLNSNLWKSGIQTLQSLPEDQIQKAASSISGSSLNQEVVFQLLREMLSQTAVRNQVQNFASLADYYNSQTLVQPKAVVERNQKNCGTPWGFILIVFLILLVVFMLARKK